ncbi:MAG: hypothetical protein A4E73_00721 [Syntrophaceae bacterium PtaU1.Bin231]|nr:MAG: hypothetical protein A4E73_00721 [Syntrophaceae bacterium PtaU1.Bin231]
MALFRRGIDIEVEEEGEILRIKGRLADERFAEDLHIIEAEMLVSAVDGVILDISASLPHTPLDECRNARSAVEKLQGVTIKPGFSDLVRRVLGSPEGCIHLANLVTNMGNVSVQGRAAYAHRHPQKGETAKRMLENAEQLGLINSCVSWREDGPILAEPADAA